MARRHYENQNGDGSFKNSNRHQKSEQHGRNGNHQNNNRSQRPEAQNLQKKASEQHSRDSAQQRGFIRERGREADSQQQRHSGFPGRYPGNYKSKAEETIDDIKQDIIRLEKEIELEIKEIRSLKL